MGDMLVRLYDLPSRPTPAEGDASAVFLTRRAMPWERLPVVGWVRSRFGEGWAGECDCSFDRLPVSCHIALIGSRLVGFACHEATARGFFGPVGVEEAERGAGIGESLVIAGLSALRDLGYAYGIIGGVEDGRTGYYARVAGAVPIEGSCPGIYTGRLDVP